jgi:CRP/FNR family cyclic AMP-dependent transcriptional regulator
MNPSTMIVPMSAPASTEVSNAAGCASDLAQQLYPTIAQQPFFKGLNVHQLQLLADSAMGVDFRADELIFSEGAPANRFYIILEGKVVLESDVKERGVVPICTLGPGDNLGWSWLFAPYYLHFSARAIEPVKTIFFYGTRLQQQCEEDHELGYELMKRVAEVLIQNLHATQQRLMECAPEINLNT